MDQGQCNSLHKPLKALFATSMAPNYMDGLQPKTKKMRPFDYMYFNKISENITNEKWE